MAIIEKGFKSKILDTTGTNTINRKMIELHQNTEQLKINKYLEGNCFFCMKKDLVFANVFEVCRDCIVKKPEELVLSVLTMNVWGLCWICGQYKTEVFQINVRQCGSCSNRMKSMQKKLNEKGGPMKADPFWQNLYKQTKHDMPQWWRSQGWKV